MAKNAIVAKIAAPAAVAETEAEMRARLKAEYLADKAKAETPAEMEARIRADIEAEAKSAGKAKKEAKVVPPVGEEIDWLFPLGTKAGEIVRAKMDDGRSVWIRSGRYKTYVSLNDPAKWKPFERSAK